MGTSGAGRLLGYMVKARKQKAGTIGQNIARLRRAAGLSQRDLGAKADVHYVTIANLERGQSQSADDVTVEKLAAAFNVKPADLREPTVTTTPVEPLLKEFLESPHAQVLDPPLSDEELTWLRGLPGVVWIDLQPSAKSFSLLVEAYRAREKKKEGK